MKEAEINRIKHIVCCSPCDSDRCCRGTDKCEAEIWAEREKLVEMDERAQEAFRQLARMTNTSVQEVMERCLGLWKGFGESAAVVAKQLSDFDPPDRPRTPAEIKKDIKHEKNPMRLQQLNKELNESRKAYKRK
ncbi:MAG: hypothetical protein K5819_07845 [Lachnospiraceae bacterium]|nr:hypothetical protein [Lachnospiraceae bacterium]